jgi:hypothetical protein
MRQMRSFELIGESKRGNVMGPLEAEYRVLLDVKVSDGEEIGSWPGASEFDSHNILDLARSFEAGTLGPRLGDVFQNDATEFDYLGEKATELEYTSQPAAFACAIEAIGTVRWPVVDRSESIPRPISRFSREGLRSASAVQSLLADNHRELFELPRVWK